MKRVFFFAAISVIAAGCTVPAPRITNAAGQPVRFENPLLSKDELRNATFVLLEKSIADGKYHLVSVSKQRQPIKNARQERIAFSADLTHYAPDYQDRDFQTYNDPLNYQQKTVVYICDAAHLALMSREPAMYTPCNSAFATRFMPMGIEKNYAMGRLDEATYRSYESPQTNQMRIVNSPRYALDQAGVMQNLGQLENAR
ncbi:hypothetical protein CY652_11775 [Burkholderia sp. WAC0059]|uniref:hypothetical protein n=1 Tax=Burkholderia sp. WAC0059 TaxID=2066022 RepID=UPI000C7ED041|nr:hypothetical protein [Burkholderia sp. WAC0059]PLZ02400.1 hypothetical protein CY652_11775 [Burkholderia sp. WAC0059]